MQTFRLVSGDLLALLAFVLVGRIQHGLPLGLAGVIATSFPFALTWLAAGFFSGLLKWQPRQGAMNLFKKTFVHWVLGIPAGMLIRILFTGEGITLIFFLVTMSFTALFIFSWRMLYWLSSRKRIAE